MVLSAVCDVVCQRISMSVPAGRMSHQVKSDAAILLGFHDLSLGSPD